MKKVCVIGLGYIGLPTSIVIAECGMEVCGVDIDQTRVESINKGDPVIQEPGINEKLRTVLRDGRFYATTVMAHADYFLIAVPTPIKKDKQADLSYVFNAAKNVTSVLKKDNVIILESTVPVGVTQELAGYIQRKTGLIAGKDFFVAYCPERVLPGNIFYELVENARIIGGINQTSVHKAKHLYAQFVRGNLYLTNAATAEMVKLIENSARDVQIAFAHQVASMSASIGLNPYEVIELANKHPRVSILQPTCGVGGHCIAIDPWFLVQSFPEQASLLREARKVNDNRPYEIITRIYHEVTTWQQHHKKRCTVLLLGLTYKPDVDDLRESPALLIARKLSENLAINLLVCEPHVKKAKLVSLFGDIIVSLDEGLAKADIIACLVGHTVFKHLEQRKDIIDCCGILYRSRKNVQKQEVVFWPAQSMLDFFIANQQSVHEEESDSGKEFGV